MPYRSMTRVISLATLRPAIPRLIVCVGLTMAGCVADGDGPHAPRHVVNTGWDTVFAVGSTGLGDTLLLDPWRLAALHNELVVVVESKVQQVRAFDGGGLKKWTFGTQGQGPGEIGSAEQIFFGPDGNLRIWDGRNRKILEVDSSGTCIGEQYFRDLWGLSTHPVPYGDNLVWTQLSEHRPAFISTMDGLQVVDSMDLTWPVPKDLPRKPSLMGFSAGFDRGWVTGLWVGPLFAVGGPEGVKVFPYVETFPFPFAYAPGRWKQTDPMADSAYIGAMDVAVAGRQIFFLSGGRPKRRAHEQEPTRYIDVYGLDGQYGQSYYLPFHSWAMTTTDGEIFYVLTNVDDLYPFLFALRPRFD